MSMEDKRLLILEEIAGEGNERPATAQAWMVDKDCIILHDDTAYTVKYIIDYRKDDSWEVLMSFYRPLEVFDIQQNEIYGKKWGIIDA